MDAVFSWILINPILAGAIIAPIGLFLVDLILGAIPDRWVPYVGGIRWALGKTIAVLETLPESKKIKAALWLLRGLLNHLSK